MGWCHPLLLRWGELVDWDCHVAKAPRNDSLKEEDCHSNKLYRNDA